MAVRVSDFDRYVLIFALIIQICNSTAAISTTDVKHYPKAISDLEEVIVRGLGFQSDDVKISGFDLRDALTGQSIAYEFALEIDDKVLPLKLLDDVNRWKHVDLPILQVADQTRHENGAGLVAKKKKNSKMRSPVLAPFQLAGPMELWIQDAKKLKLSLPHHGNDGDLRKVILADGAVVTVKGAKSVNLLRPVEFDLPLNKTQNRFASGILTLADHLQHAARTREQLVSLCIVGPTSLTSPKPSINRSNTLWPVVSVNGSNTHLTGFEKLLSSILGSKASEEGSFRILRADVSAHTFLKIGFQVEKLTGNGPEWLGYPKWRTKPEIIRMHFEVLARLDGDKIVPERVIQVDPAKVKDTMAPNVITGNISSTMAFTMTPPKPFTL